MEINLLSIKAKHLTGGQSAVANWFSQCKLRDSECQLHSKAFVKVVCMFGRPVMDLFGTGTNVQIPGFPKDRIWIECLRHC